MADFIYSSEGRARGFRIGSYIYGLDGKPAARVWAERVYRFDGTYVGAIFQNMVIDKPSVSGRNLPPQAPPPPAKPVKNVERRQPIPSEYPDVPGLFGNGDPDTADSPGVSLWGE